MKSFLSCSALVVLVSWTAFYAQAVGRGVQEAGGVTRQRGGTREARGTLHTHAMEHETDAKLHEDLANQYAEMERLLAGESRDSYPLVHMPVRGW
jgi:hypothetical protein